MARRRRFPTDEEDRGWGEEEIIEHPSSPEGFAVASPSSHEGCAVARKNAAAVVFGLWRAKKGEKEERMCDGRWKIADVKKVTGASCSRFRTGELEAPPSRDRF